MSLKNESSKYERLEESQLFKSRLTERAFSILVENEEKFRVCVSLSLVLFDLILNCTREQLISRPYNEHKNPISIKEKLVVSTFEVSK